MIILPLPLVLLLVVVAVLVVEFKEFKVVAPAAAAAAAAFLAWRAARVDIRGAFVLAFVVVVGGTMVVELLLVRPPRCCRSIKS